MLQCKHFMILLDNITATGFVSTIDIRMNFNHLFEHWTVMFSPVWTGAKKDKPTEMCFADIRKQAADYDKYK